MSELELSWCAGFIDGEANFSLTRSKYKSGSSYRIRCKAGIRCSQATYREPLDRLQRNLGGTVIEVSRRTVTGRRVWIWSIDASNLVGRAIRMIIKYLTIKRLDALILLSFCDNTPRKWQPPSAQQKIAQYSAISNLRSLRKQVDR